MGGEKTLRLYSLGIGFRDGLHLMAWNGRRRQNVTLTLWFFYPLDGSATPDVVGWNTHDDRDASGCKTTRERDLNERLREFAGLVVT